MRQTLAQVVRLACNQSKLVYSFVFLFFLLFFGSRAYLTTELCSRFSSEYRLFCALESNRVKVRHLLFVHSLFNYLTYEYAHGTCCGRQCNRHGAQCRLRFKKKKRMTKVGKRYFKHGTHSFFFLSYAR